MADSTAKQEAPDIPVAPESSHTPARPRPNIREPDDLDLGKILKLIINVSGLLLQNICLYIVSKLRHVKYV